MLDNFCKINRSLLMQVRQTRLKSSRKLTNLFSKREYFTGVGTLRVVPYTENASMEDTMCMYIFMYMYVVPLYSNVRLLANLLICYSNILRVFSLLNLSLNIEY